VYRLRGDETAARASAGPELGLHLKYDRRRFASAAVDGVLRQLRSLLAQMVEAPQRTLGEFSLVLPESHQIPDPAQTLPEPRLPSLPALFREAAGSRPEAPAVEQGSRSWTYRELDASSAALAHALRDGGLRPGEVVAVTGPRSFGLVASALGVLRGGGALLLLDPQLPAERRRLMLQRGGARCLVLVGGPGEDGGRPRDLPGLALLTVDRESGLPARRGWRWRLLTSRSCWRGSGSRSSTPSRPLPRPGWRARRGK
jgi:non-ribosomal peptide synthetase component F